MIKNNENINLKIYIIFQLFSLFMLSKLIFYENNICNWEWI